MKVKSTLLCAALIAPASAYGFASVERTRAPAAPVARPAPAALDRGGGTERPERRVVPRSDEPILLAANRVQVTIQDQVAVARVVHLLQNNTDQILQARYVVPLGERAHVSGYAIWEQGERVVGELMDVREAERLYRRVTRQELTRQEEVSQTVRAVRVARDPGILRQMAPDRFETHVYPLLPWALKQVEFSYSEALPRAEGWCVWRFPLEAAQAFKTPIGEVLFEVDLGDSAGVGEVETSWPGAEVTRREGRVRVRVHARDHAPARPFELRWRSGLAPLSPAVLAHRSGEGEGYALVRVALPEAARSTRPSPGAPARGPRPPDAPLQLAFALDVSRSLAGAKPQRHQRALAGLLAALGPQDEVCVLRFGGEVRRAWAGLRPAAQVEPAELALPERGRGPTALVPALQAAFASVGAGGARVVVLATDGVTLEDPAQVLAAVEPNGTRLLVIGTGHDDDVDLLSRLAERHGGALWIPGAGERDLRWAARDPQLLAQPYGQAGLPGEALDPRALLSELRAPAVCGARLEGAPEAYPLRPLDARALPAGGVATFALRYATPGPLPVRFRAVVGDQPVEVSFTLELPAREPHHRFVAAYWARARAAELLREHPLGDADPNRPEVVRLALEHRFVTPYTAFLSLPDSERERLFLAPSPSEGDEDLYEFKAFEGGAPEAEVWLLVLVGLALALLLQRSRDPAPPLAAGGLA